MKKQFKIKSKFPITEAQNDAVNKLVYGIEENKEHQLLLGVTGSGKTFVMANIIERTQKPTLILAHNKTLAAQLYSEFCEFFPENSVKYFVSFYDYYQPEAYIPRRDLYIEKESEINEVIEKYRNSATQSLMSRRDTIIIASVSCIYGLGDPEDYMNLSRTIKLNESYNRDKLLRHLTDMQYDRAELDFKYGSYRVRGDTVEIYLATEDKVVRLEYFGDEIENIKIIDPISGEIYDRPNEIDIFPAKHFVTPYEKIKEIIPNIEKDLAIELNELKAKGKDIEAYRLEQRVKYDIEMLRETGFCSGIENYSRYIDKRKPGSPPSTLLDYFPDDWLLIVDESHITIPQVRGMFNGDLARKTNLVDYGFRLKAALDNRPLKFSEFSSKINKVIYCSATPNEYEINLSKAGFEFDKKDDYEGVAELVIRPTGLLDPVIDIRPIQFEYFESLKKQIQQNSYSEMSLLDKTSYDKNQIDDLFIEIKNRVEKNERVLITTLTKRMAEDLSAYLLEKNINVTYIHSDLDAIKRVELLRDLRTGRYDVLVGINLLREGLDLPEVSLVAIMDADKEGFLRSRSSLIQIIGRAARHLNGKVILYANNITGSMKSAIDETLRRRTIQKKYNEDNNIVPKSISKDINNILESTQVDDKDQNESIANLIKSSESYAIMGKKEKNQLLKQIELQMTIFADMMEFEKAAEMRDLLNDLKQN